jgi:membrane protein required for colicin V production
METYDIVMIVVLAGTALLGALRGMVSQLASLASLVLSYFLALRFSAQLAPLFHTEAPWNRFLAMLVIYIGTSLAVWFVSRTLSGFIDRLRLQEFDRQLGLLFGAAKGVLLCVIITFFAVTLSDTARDHVLKSRSGYFIAELLERSHSVMPEELHDVLKPYMDRLEKELEPVADGPSAAKAADTKEPSEDPLKAAKAWFKSMETTK